MRNLWTVRNITAAVAVPALALAGAALYTRSAEAVPGRLPVGTWNQIVHLPRADEQTMVSLHADGTVSAIAPKGPMPCPSGTGMCALESPSVGMWRITGPRTFEITIKEYVYDSDGTLVNFIVPHVRATLSADGGTYTATATTGFWNTRDELLFTSTVHDDGTRLRFSAY